MMVKGRRPAAWLAFWLVGMWIAGPAAADAAGGEGAAGVEFGRAVFIAEDRIEALRARVEALRARVEAEREPTWTAWQALVAEAEGYVDHQPGTPEVWYVPPFYRDAQGHRESKNVLQDDANASYTLALAYRITGEARYAEAAVRLIEAWSGLEELRREDDSTLSFSYHFPAMIFAADLLRGYEGFSVEAQERFAAFVRERALPMNTMGRRNNWGNWGLVLVLACAAYLEDEQLFDEGVQRWKHFIGDQIAEDGHLPHEVTRNRGIGERGIWYSHFTLMPQTLAAEIALVNGADLYDYESEGGRTLREAFHRLAPWAREPETFPYFQPEDEQTRQLGTDYVNYFEILNARWPHRAAAEMLQERRPLTANHSAPRLTFTHGQPLEE